MKTLKNIIETYNWLSESFVHQTEETTEQETVDSYSLLKDRVIYYKTKDNKPISKWYNFYEKYKSDIPELIISNTYDEKSDIGMLLFKEPVTSIGNYAFQSCFSLTSVTIPESVTSIGDEAFQGCSSLTSITIPEGVSSIGYQAFSGCSSLKSITIPESVTSIGSSAFEGCGFQSLILPNNLQKIDFDAFRDNTNLKKLVLPDNIQEIGENAFWECPYLLNIEYQGKRYQGEESIIRLLTVLEYNNVSLGDDIFDCVI